MNDYVHKELKGSFNYFWIETNTDKTSQGYGMVRDRTSQADKASIAAVGFALAAYVIGVEHQFITREEALERARLTAHTLRFHTAHYKGFFSHFVRMSDAKRYQKSEFSTIDTAIVLNGLLCVDAYFNDPTLHQDIMTIVERVDWAHFVFEFEGKKTFRMAYNPDRDGDYRPGEDGWIYQWHMPAEQLMMYLLAAGSNTLDDATANALYFGFQRYVGGYGPHQFVYTPGGALFVYQFTHAFFDFQQFVDAKGFDWFENSKQATLSNRQWCLDASTRFKTLHEHAWGLTACDHPKGYSAFGTPPFDGGLSDRQEHCNGTIAPYGAIGSIIFTPQESLASLAYHYENHPTLLGPYGLKDSYNLDVEPPWYAEDYLGIDKGLTVVMLDNYLKGSIQRLYTEHPIIQKAIEVLRFKRKEG